MDGDGGQEVEVRSLEFRTRHAGIQLKQPDNSPVVVTEGDGHNGSDIRVVDAAASREAVIASDILDEDRLASLRDMLIHRAADGKLSFAAIARPDGGRPGSVPSIEEYDPPLGSGEDPEECIQDVPEHFIEIEPTAQGAGYLEDRCEFLLRQYADEAVFDRPRGIPLLQNDTFAREAPIDGECRLDVSKQALADGNNISPSQTLRSNEKSAVDPGPGGASEILQIVTIGAAGEACMLARDRHFRQRDPAPRVSPDDDLALFHVDGKP